MEIATAAVVKAAPLSRVPASNGDAQTPLPEPHAGGFVPHPAIAVTLLAAIVALTMLWRLPVRPIEWRFMLCENDSLYQLHRVQACLANYPHVPSVDSYSHYPHPYRVPWQALHSLFYATIARLTGLHASERDGLVRVLSWIPPLFGVLAVLLTMAIARAYTASRTCVYAVGFLGALAAETCRPFFFGTIDHHLFACIGVLLMVLGRLRHRLGLWLLGLCALLAMTPEAIIYVSALLGCLFLADIAATPSGADSASGGRALWYLSPAFVATLSWLLQRWVETEPLPVLNFSWAVPSVFQPLWVTLLGTSTLASLWTWDRCRTRSVRVAAAAAAGVLALFAAMAIVFLYGTGNLGTIVQRLLLRNRIFVAEETSVFQAGFWSAPPWDRILALSGVFIAVKLVAGVRRKRDADHWFRWITLAIALVLGMREFRHLYVLGPLLLIGIGVAAFETEAAVRRLPMFSGRWRQVIPAALVAVAIVPFFVTANVMNRVAIHGEVCDAFPIAEELATWLKTHTPEPQPEKRRPPLYSVFGPWSIGHQLHVLGERPVVVDPLNYGTEDDVEEALVKVWLAQSADELIAALRAYGVRYLVLTNPAEEIVGVMRRVGLRRDEYVHLTAAGEPVFLPAMSRFASFRLYMSAGQSIEFHDFAAREFSAESETYTADGGRPVVVAKGQIYEVAFTPPGTD